MLTQTSNKQKGFTIIEVLIVLAIAGLILLIVFLAVPALNRQSRNTQRATDVGAIGAALTEFTNNNNGVWPTDNNDFHTRIKPNFKTGFYDSAVNNRITFTANAGASAPAGPANAVVDTVEIHTYSKCNGNLATATGATRRNAIALYRIESGGANGMLICKEL